MGQSFKASYVELTQKVSWPTRSELTNSAIVVMIASFIIALVVLLIDTAFDYSLKGIYSMLASLLGK